MSLARAIASPGNMSFTLGWSSRKGALTRACTCGLASLGKSGNMQSKLKGSCLAIEGQRLLAQHMWVTNCRTLELHQPGQAEKKPSLVRCTPFVKMMSLPAFLSSAPFR